MRPVSVDEWIEALESGEYRKGHNQLCEMPEDGGVTHCAFGVLLDLMGVNEWRYSDHDGQMTEPQMIADLRNSGHRATEYPFVECGWAEYDRSRPPEFLSWKSAVFQANDEHAGDTFGEVVEFLKENKDHLPEKFEPPKDKGEVGVDWVEKLDLTG